MSLLHRSLSLERLSHALCAGIFGAMFAAALVMPAAPPHIASAAGDAGRSLRP